VASLKAAIIPSFGTLGNMGRQSYDFPVPTCLARMDGCMAGCSHDFPVQIQLYWSRRIFITKAVSMMRNITFLCHVVGTWYVSYADHTKLQLYLNMHNVWLWYDTFIQLSNETLPVHTQLSTPTYM
jgi:hypothetical protein